MLLLSGTIPTLTSIPLLDTEAFAEKKGLKHDSEKDDKKDYQQKFKRYDFEKYLSHQYEAYKEYTQYYGDLLYSVENSGKHPFFTHENVRDQDDNRKQKQSDTNNDDGANGKSEEMDSSEKSQKKTYKHIKIIECSSLNINDYDVEDYHDVEKILNAEEAQDSIAVEKLLHEVTTSENNDDDDNDNDNDNQVEESHIKNSKGKGSQEFNIGSETKIIFICTNDNLNMDQTNGHDMVNSLPNDGIMLPVTVLQNNNNNIGNEVTTTTS
jgi:hypothetical protein